MPEDKHTTRLCFLVVSLALLTLGLHFGPIQDSRPVVVLQTSSQEWHKTQTRAHTSSFMACQALCEADALCTRVTYTPDTKDCVLNFESAQRGSRPEKPARPLPRSCAALCFLLRSSPQWHSSATGFEPIFHLRTTSSVYFRTS